MKEAMFYKKLKDKQVQCRLCPKYCLIKDKERGNCGVRINNNGKLFSLVYGFPCSVAIDPIEKKPLYHFKPGIKVLSIGTAGCNMHCKFCQNWEISQMLPEDVHGTYLEPKKIVEYALEQKCEGIAYTYTEPTIFYEYVLECAKLAKKKGLKNIMVTNGFINKEPLKKLYKYIDAANVDLKGFDEEFYEKICGGELKAVLKSLKNIKKTKCWIEITNLIINDYNDDMKDIKNMCIWIKENLGSKTPLHFSRFFPKYRMQDVNITPIETMKKAYKAAKSVGLEYIYLGNVVDPKSGDTFCSKCKKLLIRRDGFELVVNNVNKGKCNKCGNKIDGVW